jgi:DNA-binding NarL/FixJ family response regulator
VNNYFIVDDHPLTAAGLRSIFLSSYPSAVCLGEAYDVELAAAQILQTQPDLIFLDHFLKERTGMDLLINLQDYIKPNRFVLVTQLQNPTALRQYVAMGVRGLVSKTCDRKDLQSAISNTGQTPYLSLDLKTLVATPSAVDLLTPRELEVVAFVAAGKTNREIGVCLDCSEFTVKAHKANIMRKLDLSSSTEIGVWAMRNHVLS